MPWDLVLKLFLLKKILVGPMNNAWDPLKNAQDNINANVEEKTSYPN